jgi:uncharacterized protein YoaH (UPF0181 family)
MSEPNMQIKETDPNTARLLTILHYVIKGAPDTPSAPDPTGPIPRGHFYDEVIRTDSTLRKLELYHERNVHVMETITQYSQAHKSVPTTLLDELRANTQAQRELHAQLEQEYREELKQIAIEHPESVNKDQLYILYMTGVVILGDLTEEQQTMVVEKEAELEEKRISNGEEESW